MPLLTTMFDQVSKQTKEKGRQCYLANGVQFIEGDHQSVVAQVKGNDVTLERKRQRVEVWCSCSDFDRNFWPCKHIWAALLAAERDDYLLGRSGSLPRRLEAVDMPRWLKDDDDPVSLDGDDAWYEDDYPHGYEEEWRPRRSPPVARKPARKKRPSWKQQLSALQESMNGAGRLALPAADQEILYILHIPAPLAAEDVTVDIAQRTRKRNGEWSKPKNKSVFREQLALLPDRTDREIISLLLGPKSDSTYDYYEPGGCHYRLSPEVAALLLPRMCRTGRCALRSGDQDDLRLLGVDDGPAFAFHLQVALEETGRHYRLDGCFSRDTERMSLGEPQVLFRCGLMIAADRLYRLQDSGAFELLSLLHGQKGIKVPAGKKEQLVEMLLGLPHLPPLELPEELRFEEVQAAPRPQLKVWSPEQQYRAQPRVHARPLFAYDDAVIEREASQRGIYQRERKRLLVRDLAAEDAALARLAQLGFQSVTDYNGDRIELPARSLPAAVRTLLAEGWHVEAEGKLYRKPGNFHINVRSEIDWFELHASVDFGDVRAGLPALLAALKRGDNTILLDDGTFGMLPEDWLKKYGVLAGLGTAEDDHLRFSKCQVGLLDALLASQPEATCDELFAQARDELRRFDGIKPLAPPAEFQGALRGYQCDGLGWLDFLRRFGFGGCLADDMGLGKTVQVLALLETRRRLRADGKNGRRPGPSLVVMPRSLVFNWKQEAARFTPKLRILDHTGIGRTQDGEQFQDHDVILTTYGTLRRDVLLFKDLTFDYAILDEAQAIKNAQSESAKAARLLKAAHRLALSGTPVENHLGELWSLFEFLNPGMLGSASVFRLGGAGARNPDEETRKLLAQALRPFLLRRTKDQVVSDLPQKLEQTLYCELEGEQRRLYDELRDHYRRELLGRVDEQGLNKSKMQVLEALLRLRQAACHAGLVDKRRTGEPSAKLDLLLPQLAEVLDEGHKALVFSQFTSLLSIVRARLDKQGVAYEYLDGKTRDRQARVERFQNDPDCKLFLVSLKAGGLGLNLTAAEYVFLLDPWWNPAVEAQAIDRAHRIGQSRRVFAYRLIARGTVEEKVLQLQESKRSLADAIINADNSLIRNLGREELELLLS